MNRRRFLKTALGLGAACWAGSTRLLPAQVPPAARRPGRVLYNNDLTNLFNCVSPWHAGGPSFDTGMIEASVDEVAGTGVDVHLLAPGLGWVPLWPSAVYPPEEHRKWIRDRYGIDAAAFPLMRYVLDGGDPIQVFLDRCRLRGQAPFLSFRLNDAHCWDYSGMAAGDPGLSAWCAMSLARFYVEHPEYRLAPDIRNWNTRVHNWAIPEARAYKAALLAELGARYDFDGLELDFLRHANFFRQQETTSAQRAAIMTAFVSEVRAMLDRTARNGRRRWLSVRIPALAATHDSLGIDPAAFAAAGVDLFNLSSYYAFEQQTDAARIRRSVPDRACYLELTNTPYTGPAAITATRTSEKYDNFSFRRATDAELRTTARLAYARGLDGISLFNFVYYRAHSPALIAARIGPFCEPPFGAIRGLGDPAALARPAAQSYFHACGFAMPNGAERPLGDWTHGARLLDAARPALLGFDLAPPDGGWSADAVLRVQSLAPLEDARLLAYWNETRLAPAEAAPAPNPYSPQLMGTPETLRAWTVPAAALRPGGNRLELRLEAGAPPRLVFVELAA